MASKLSPYLLDDSLLKTPDDFKIMYADLRFRNTCNYACIYCGLYLSSTWGKELGKFVKSDESTIENTKNYLLEHVSDIKDIYLAGGEPLLIKENEEILRKFLEFNSDVLLTVNTNLSCINNNSIFDLLLQFPNVTWIVSVDDTDERYNYMRYPGDWNQFYDNLLLFKSVIKETHTVTFNSVFCSVNAKSVFQMIDKLEEAGFQESYFGLGYVSSGPSIWLDPRHLPQSYLAEIIDFIKLRIQDLDNKSFSDTKKGMSRSTYQSIIDKLEDSNFNRDTEMLISGLKKLDDRRNLNSREVFPELYNVINK
jgi:sulfatase maturation enzyme AslB (radical SAM superfamily)